MSYHEIDHTGNIPASLHVAVEDQARLGQRFCGVVERDGLPAEAPDEARADGFVEADTLTVTPATPMREAVPLLEGRGEPRLVVLDEDGATLRGLLCANTTGTGFCLRP